MNRLLIVVAVSVALATPAQVYKYIDKDGKVQYTDQPPQDAKKSELKVDAPSEPGKAAKDDWRGKEKELDVRLIETRRKRDACIRAKEILQTAARILEQDKRTRYYYNGTEITPQLIDQARREVRDSCAN